MLKRILPAIVFAWLAVLPAFAQPRIATVDFQKVFDKYWRREQADAALRDREQTFEKELKAMYDDREKIVDDYTKLTTAAADQSVTKEERDKRKALADNKLLELKTADNTLRTARANAQDTILSQRKRLMESIVTEINDAVKAKAKASGFTLVLNSAASGGEVSPAVLYTNGENDLTETIIAQLNVGAPPANEAKKTGDKPADKSADKGTDRK